MQLDSSDKNRDVSRKVYVVHGRNLLIKDAMYAFLQALGLQPITKEAAVNWTEEGTPFVGHVIDTAFEHAQAVIILFTGEDMARLRKDLRHDQDTSNEKDFSPQPRSDQIFEAGYAFGRFPKRTILIRVGHIRLFSDIAGRYALSFTGKENERQD